MLEALRRRAGGPGTKITLQAVGVFLRQLGLPGRSGTGSPLREVMSGLDGFCRVENDIVEFLDGPPPPLTDQNDEPGEGEVLRPDLFRALLRVASEEDAWFDLETRKIISTPAGTPPPGEPGQMLRVPVLDLDEQKALTQQYLQGKLPQAALSDLLAAPGGGGWMVRIRNDLSPDLSEGFRTASRGWILALARRWMEAHEIPVAHFIRTVSQKEPATEGTIHPVVERGNAAPAHHRPRWERDDPASALRRHLHHYIDRMTLAELSVIPIPARLLIDD